MAELIAEKAVEPKPPKVKRPVPKSLLAATYDPEHIKNRTAKATKAAKAKYKKGLIAPTNVGSMPRNVPMRDKIAALVEAEKEAKRILKIMEKEGLIPDDHMAKAALQATFEMVTAPLPPRERLAAARTILEYTKQKPVSTTNLNIKTAEDFLDELAADDDN